MIRSTDHQLRDIREERGDFAITHIDTCLSSFLSDHHNRDGELLLGVYVDGSTTVADVLDGLDSEFATIGWDLGESRKGFDYDKAKQALADLRNNAADKLALIFDSSLDLPDEEEECEEACQAWFLIHWEVPDDCDIVGYNPKSGFLIQWNAEEGKPYESETPEEYGLHNIYPNELQKMQRDGWEGGDSPSAV